MLFLDYLRSKELYKLLAGNNLNDEGNLLQITNDKTSESQIELIRFALRLSGTSSGGNFLEIGTNRGMFAYLLSEIAGAGYLTTIDINPDASKGVELLNQHTHLDVDFLYGDSKELLPQLQPGKFDLVWVDGNHTLEGALSDLTNCSKLNIPFILVDDCSYPEVQSAVNIWLQDGLYQEISNPFISQDDRKARLFQRI